MAIVTFPIVWLYAFLYAGGIAFVILGNLVGVLTVRFIYHESKQDPDDYLGRGLVVFIPLFMAVVDGYLLTLAGIIGFA